MTINYFVLVKQLHYPWQKQTQFFFHGQRSKSIKLCKQIKKVESVVKSVPFPIIEFYRSNCSFWVNWHRFCEIMTGRKTPSRHYHRHVSPYYSSVVFWVCALLKLGDQSNSSFSASQTVNCIVGTRMSTGYSISRWQAFTLSLLDWVHTKTHFKGTNLFHTFIPFFFWSIEISIYYDKNFQWTCANSSL